MTAAALIMMIIVLSLGADQWLPRLPWYTPFIFAFLAGLAAGRMKAKAFLVGFLGVGIFWTLVVTVIHMRNDGILTSRMSALFTEQMGFHVGSVLLLVATPLLGALLGGLAALSGKLFSEQEDIAMRVGRRRKKRGGYYKLKI